MFGKRKPIKEELPEKIVRRARMIPTPDLLDWAENALYTAHKNLSAFRSRPDSPNAAMYYAETKQSVAALSAVLAELEGRTGIKADLAPAPAVSPSLVQQLRQEGVI